ncbi:hypothetical protein RAS1_25920 [Phycisphaerae bacterium RAS1]|nr:hypothetical protein RAS1_25920 [Phycisphaerae bacterium RAS1]
MAQRLDRATALRRAALLLLLLGLFWRVIRFAMGFPIWGDEAFVAVNLVTRDYAGMLRPLDYGQIVPLMFMWGELFFARLLGLSDWALRLFPSIAGGLALILFARFSSRVLPPAAALLAIGFLAAATYPVRHSAEVKPYAQDMLISLACTMLGWRVYLRPTCRAGWAGLLLLAAAGVWWSLPSVFAAGSVGLLLTYLLIRRFSAGLLIGWLLFGLLLIGNFATNYLVYAGPHLTAAAGLVEIEMWERTFPPLDRPWLLPLWLIYMHTGNMLAYPLGGDNGGSTATLLVVIIGGVRLWKTRRPLLTLLLMPLALTFIAAALHKYPYGGSARTSLYMAPAFCLLGGLGLRVVIFHLWRAFRRAIPQRRAGLMVAALALGGICVGGAVADVLRPYKDKPVLRSRQAVDAIVRETRPGDGWVVFYSPDRVPHAPSLLDSRGTGGQFIFDILRFAPVPLTWAPRAEDVHAAHSGGRIWLLAYRGVRLDFPEEQFAAYRDALAVRLGAPEFRRYEIKRRKDDRGAERIEAVDVHCFGGSAGVPAALGRADVPPSE